ncbi:zinc transporter binding subunit ZevA [Aggregatibacter kilianii]|uniref:zinc transporter binding subunit ZevA n=1 Tax=Aggregatibacter kilianii TaxID=2025884 RepID=UPI000D649160|nr:zinc transporter binding subunit ZevA [Aggregatibacter kilianii]
MKKPFLLLLSLLSVQPVFAHPHAFIEMKNKILVENQQLVGFSMQWILDEPSSAAMLYDVQQTHGDKKALQKLIDEVIGNVVNEHYFSYLFDKQGNKIKYSAMPKNYGMKSSGSQVLYFFDFTLSKPQLLKDNEFTLSTYDPTYYVSMYYADPTKSAVDFSALPANCQGEVLEPQVDDKIKRYASSLDQTQRDEDNTLGAMFAQKVRLICR